VTARRLGALTPRRAATLAAGVAMIVAGRFVGGYGGAVVIGAGIGLAVIGIGRREPHLLHRRATDEDDGAEPEEEW